MRKRLPLPTLKEEKRWVIQFALIALVPDTKSRGVRVRELFALYQDYLTEMGYGKTQLSALGFGRMLPKNFKRKPVSIEGVILKTIVGVKLARLESLGSSA